MDENDEFLALCNKFLENIKNAEAISKQEYQEKMTKVISDSLVYAVRDYYAGGCGQWSEGRFDGLIDLSLPVNGSEYTMEEEVTASMMPSYHGWWDSTLDSEGTFKLLWTKGEHGNSNKSGDWNRGYSDPPAESYKLHFTDLHDKALNEILDNIEINVFNGIS